MTQVSHPKDHELHVDGTDEFGCFAGDGTQAPFVVFDADAQENIAGPFATRAGAQLALDMIKNGAEPTLDVAAMLRYSEKRYMGEWSQSIPASILNLVARIRVWAEQLMARAHSQLKSS